LLFRFTPIIMSISVYSQQQDLHALPFPPSEHSTTRRLSIQILKAGMARPVGQNAIQLTTALRWAEIKKLARAHADPWLVRLTDTSILPAREYPSQLTCMAEAFQRCMRYPVQLAKDQQSWQYTWEKASA
jgi:hypothetical protein